MKVYEDVSAYNRAWVGGMGMIVFAIAILPLLGIGGMQLFSAESP